MRIDDHGIIRVSFRTGALKFLGRIPPGTEVEARIVERHRGNTALLDIGGNRVRAGFMNGLPRADRLLLKLEEKSGNQYLFRLLNTIDKSEFLEKILGYSVFSHEDFSRQHVYEISRFLSGRMADLFGLNEFLLGLASRGEKRSHASSALFRALMKMGLDRDSMNFITFLSLDARAGSAMLPLLLVMGYDRGFFEKWNSGREEWIEQEADKLISEIEEKATGDEKQQIITGILRECMSGHDGDETAASGLLPFIDRDEYTPVSYIGKNGRWIFSMRLSRLGTVDILSQGRGNSLEITVFTDSPAATDHLRSRVDHIHENLSGAGISAMVRVIDRQNAVDKIVEINSYYSLNSAFDTKV